MNADLDPLPCRYLDGVLHIAALGLVPAGTLRHVTILHDDWCPVPVLDGAGMKRSESAFYLDGASR